MSSVAGTVSAAKPATSVQFRGVTRGFPGVLALDGIDLDIEAGTCHGLVGENGAGKSTLGKILAGIYQPDSGVLMVNGQQRRFDGPRDALKAGVGMVHQELAFCENLSVEENLCLGDMPARGGFLSRRAMRALAMKRLAAIGAQIDPDRQVGSLTLAQQQMMQIAAAVSCGARILVFDEPTSSLSEHETRSLFALVRRLKADGVTCVYISHRLRELFELCENVTVLRDGRVVGTRPVRGLSENELVDMMIGRPFQAYYPKHLEHEQGRILLKVESLSSPGRFEGVSFVLRGGEVLGLAGLVGSGRTEVAQAIFGLDPQVRGNIFVDGRPFCPTDPVSAMERGIGLTPEDRKRHGLVLSMTAKQNISLPILGRLSRMGFVSGRREVALAGEYFRTLSIRAPSVDTPAAGLSGGNQQKLVMARWLAAKCPILLMDEPTRGVDIGAKADLYALMDGLARSGSGILLISSDLPEVLNLSTRVLVFRNGRLVRELSRLEATQETTLRYMTGIEGGT